MESISLYISGEQVVNLHTKPPGTTNKLRVAHAAQLQKSTRQEALAVKYLGIQNILNNTAMTQQDITIRVSPRIATVKAMVYNMFAPKRIRYNGPHLTSSLQIIKKKIDESIQNRLISNNMTSIPTKLLYTPKMITGLGFKCLKDIIISTKTVEIHRA